MNAPVANFAPEKGYQHITVMGLILVLFSLVPSSTLKLPYRSHQPPSPLFSGNLRAYLPLILTAKRGLLPSFEKEAKYFFLPVFLHIPRNREWKSDFLFLLRYKREMLVHAWLASILIGKQKAADAAHGRKKKLGQRN